MTPDQISAQFRQARQSGRALDAYPGGAVPSSLEMAIQLQEHGINAWDDTLRGWKVAAIQERWRAQYPAERLAGPVFSRTLWQTQSNDKQVVLPVIEHGGAAVEAEFAVRLRQSVTPDLAIETPAQLRDLVEGVYAAIELAASPLATLNALGPGAVISDFGNNSGLVIGPRLPDQILEDPTTTASQTIINGETVGVGNAARVPGGPLAALMFLISHLRARGRILNAGDWVSTGASTGIHPVKHGDEVCVRFGENVQIHARVMHRIAD